MKFTPDEAISYAKKDRIGEWVHQFLTTEGRNNHLSEIMKHQGKFHGPTEISLSRLKRCCGPEKTMKFHEAKDKFQERVTDLVAAIQNGWKAPPIIVWQINSGLSIADGNHRYEALKKCGYDKYLVIVWSKNSGDFERP